MSEKTQNKEISKTNTGKRIASMLLDHFALSFIIMLFFIPGMISGFASALNITHNQTNFDLFGGMSYIGLIGLAFFFCKDCIHGRSIAKRALKLQVVMHFSGNAASPLRCFIRNIFCIIWPLEVIVTLINPERRIGDFIAGTKVVPFNTNRKQPKSNYIQIALSILLAYGFMFLLMLPVEDFKSMLSSKQVVPIKSSINIQLAHETEQLFLTSLNQYLTPDILIYDEIQDNNNNLKYISVILRLKEDYLESDEDYEQIQSLTVPLLLSKYPKGTFVGQIKYVYKQTNRVSIRTIPLDWRQ